LIWTKRKGSWLVGSGFHVGSRGGTGVSLRIRFGAIAPLLSFQSRQVCATHGIFSLLWWRLSLIPHPLQLESACT
jgi:hypothetical protein